LEIKRGTDYTDWGQVEVREGGLGGRGVRVSTGIKDKQQGEVRGGRIEGKFGRLLIEGGGGMGEVTRKIKKKIAGGVFSEAGEKAARSHEGEMQYLRNSV